MRNSRVELIVRIGEEYMAHTLSVNVSSELLRELSEPMELSDSPLDILLASPGLYGGFGDAITIRKRMFKMREATAKEISEKLIESLIEYFGRNDKKAGFSKEPSMAGIDKIYGTQEQYDELFAWLTEQGKSDFIRNMYPANYGPNPRIISNFTNEQDVWLYENCSLKWVRDAIEFQYDGKPTDSLT